MESPLKNLPRTRRTLVDPSTTDSLMYITTAGQGRLVLNSHKAANDLLERRGHIYSNGSRLISKCYRDSPWRVLTELASQSTSGYRTLHSQTRVDVNQVR